MFFGEVTLSLTVHEQTALVTLVSYKHKIAAKHGSSQAIDNQWAVTSRIAN